MNGSSHLCSSGTFPEDYREHDWIRDQFSTPPPDTFSTAEEEELIDVKSTKGGGLVKKFGNHCSNGCYAQLDNDPLGGGVCKKVNSTSSKDHS